MCIDGTSFKLNSDYLIFYFFTSKIQSLSDIPKMIFDNKIIILQIYIVIYNHVQFKIELHSIKYA